MIPDPTTRSRRLLARVARRDRRDRLRPALMALHRVLLLPEGGKRHRAQHSPAEGGRGDLSAHAPSLQPVGPEPDVALDLVVHALPEQDDAILLLGDATASAARLQQRSYTRVSTLQRVEEPAPARNARLLEELRRFPDRQFAVCAIISLLPELPGETLSILLREVARVTRRWLAVALPVYPHALTTPRPGRLERPEWWDSRFREAGFSPVPIPHDPNAPDCLFLYERAWCPVPAPPSVGAPPCPVWESTARSPTGHGGAPTEGGAGTGHALQAPHRGAPTEGGAGTGHRALLNVHFPLDVSLGNAFTWCSVEFAQALEEGGHRVSWAPSEITGTLPEEERARLRRWMAAERGDVHVKWTHYWPQYARPPREGRRNFEQFALNYRFCAAREEEWDPWMRQIRASPATFLPISRFCREALLTAGVPEERCPVLPLGYSPEIDRVSDAAFLPVERSFRFLATTNCADWRRYGTDLLLEAFARAFRHGDDVCLVLRDYGGNAFLAGGYPHELAERIAAVRERGLELFYFSRFLPKEEMVRFQRACHAFVAPFRGEGFGVKVLDALACDLPVLLPLYSGPADFCDPETCFPIPFREVPVQDCLDTRNLRLGNDPVWCEADVDALADMLRAVLRDPDAARERGRRAGATARRDHSWPAVCRRFAEIAAL